MRRFACLLAAAGLALAAPATATPHDDLSAILADHWAWTLKNSPLLATRVGVHTYDAELDDNSLAAQDRQAAEAAGFVKRLDALPAAGLTEADRTNVAILRRSLTTQIEANRFSEREIEFSNRAGWHTYFADLALSLPFFTRADYDSYLARLDKVPAFAATSMAITRQAVAHGNVLPCIVLDGFAGTITGEIKEPLQSRFYAPFAGPKPATIAPADWAALQARAAATIRDKINPTYRSYADFYTREYKCRATIGASALPDGQAYYAFKVREQTTTTLTPAQIHDLGLSEVARIRAEMDALVASTGFKGDRAAYIAMLRTDPKYYAHSPHELMTEAALTAKTIDGQMPKLFGHLPRLPYTVREIPAATADGTTTAYYNDGSAAAGVAGTYYVNTTHLDQRPLFELPALTLHEAVPGHHNQISLQQELDLPPFRQFATFFTAFVEGWGLYSERLGLDIGLYDTPEKQMGRLSYEMWRACRLVVDTGIHAQGWTKAQAVQFMADNTALSATNIDAEVNRYIADPGQALAYKIGELTIRRLRTRAEAELGPKFDRRAFHDAVLGQGAIPMDLLETRMNAWIAARKAA
ncbi:MAG: DUF885 domain-containing protein [Sphingomonadaceae bacterium]|nr:DUF885 domain-containing protein [Sphingomonadaceae bacterium]